jgi:hypothetical protein
MKFTEEKLEKADLMVNGQLLMANALCSWFYLTLTIYN